MNNTIILLHDYKNFGKFEAERFQKGDLMFGDNNAPEEVKRWSIEQKEDAQRELAKHNCIYGYDKYSGRLKFAEEWALGYCECDEEGEFIQGSDFDLAEEA